MSWWPADGNPKDLIGTNDGSVRPYPESLINIHPGSAVSGKQGFAATGMTASDFWNGFNFAYTSLATIDLRKTDNTATPATFTLADKRRLLGQSQW